jgi:dCTP diphosphatase
MTSSQPHSPSHPNPSNHLSHSTVCLIRQFCADRDWDQYHTPENLAKSISIEAAELLECYQWTPHFPQADSEHIQDELADVLTYCIQMSDVLGVDMDEIVRRKLAKTEKKYPVEAVRDNPQAAQDRHDAVRHREDEEKAHNQPA